MALDYHHLLAWPVPEVRQTYSVRDSQLYALAVGLGADPTDPRPRKAFDAAGCNTRCAPASRVWISSRATADAGGLR